MSADDIPAPWTPEGVRNQDAIETLIADWRAIVGLDSESVPIGITADRELIVGVGDVSATVDLSVREPFILAAVRAVVPDIAGLRFTAPWPGWRKRPSEPPTG